MKLACSAAFLLLLAGCTSPRIRLAPPPSAEMLAAVRPTRTRVVAVPLDSVFPRVLDILLDQGYLVRSANRGLGLVTIYQQWKDNTQSEAPRLMMEGTLLFRAEGPSSSRIRASLCGKWETTSSGGVHSSSGTISDVAQDADPRDYATLLDALEQGLTHPEAK